MEKNEDNEMNGNVTKYRRKRDMLNVKRQIKVCRQKYPSKKYIPALNIPPF